MSDTPSHAIHPVTRDDHPRIVDVWERSVRATHDFITEADIAEFKPLIRDSYLDLVELRCTRDASGQVTGFLGVSDGKIEMLFIDPDLRGTGLGSALLNHATGAMKATEVDVNEQNPAAVGFYMKMGFLIYNRSELDEMGKPFPLLHMRLTGSGDTDA